MLLTAVPQVPALSQLAPLSPQREEETKISKLNKGVDPKIEEVGGHTYRVGCAQH